MMRNPLTAIYLTCTLLTSCQFCNRQPTPYGPVPSEAQLAWQRMEINMFCHFGPNTFSGAEWGDGTESEDTFRPTALDCRQWVDVAIQSGMGGIILTAKHHDGFCLWPSAFSNHTIAQSTWNEGVGDVLKCFVDACRNRVKAGVYISPWDRNHPTYGTDRYNNVFDSMLQEVHTRYGPFFEQWFDGACGEGPNGKRQRYDWERYLHTMNKIAPNCIVFSDIGPGCRWVGNEQGEAGETCWSTLYTEGATPSDNKPAPAELETGHVPNSPLINHRSSLNWIPAECDVSIRPGWFWHPQEHPKTVDELMEIYYNSVGHNGLLLLNVPPDTSGRISAEDSSVLVAFRKERERIFDTDLARGAHATAKHIPGRRFRAQNVLDTAYHTYWAAPDKDARISIELDSVTDFDIIVIQEYIPLGQRVSMVNLALDEGDGVYPQTTSDFPLCTTVGYKRIIRHENGGHWHTNHLELHFTAHEPPVINRIAIYNSAK